MIAVLNTAAKLCLFQCMQWSKLQLACFYLSCKHDCCGCHTNGVQTKGHRTKGHRQKATRQKATETKGHGQKATERSVKMLLSCQDVLERLRVVLETVKQIVLLSVLVYA